MSDYKEKILGIYERMNYLRVSNECYRTSLRIFNTKTKKSIQSKKKKKKFGSRSYSPQTQ